MPNELRSAFITYEEARKLIPFFMVAKKEAPMIEARRSSSRLIEELKNVRNEDYSPFKGYQLLLHEADYIFLMDTMEALEL